MGDATKETPRQESRRSHRQPPPRPHHSVGNQGHRTHSHLWVVNHARCFEPIGNPLLLCALCSLLGTVCLLVPLLLRATGFDLLDVRHRAARGRAPQVLEELVVAVRLIPKGLQRMKGYARPRRTDSGSAAMIRLTVAAL